MMYIYMILYIYIANSEHLGVTSEFPSFSIDWLPSWQNPESRAEALTGSAASSVRFEESRQKKNGMYPLVN